ncbi:MAG: protein kinase, partial [Chloroflexi bacterium]|nr:protein kinase [Chloroflexota bacterium]
MPGLEGKTLDRYELRRLIGKGGMADVYEGFDPRFERVVAIKIFKRDDEELLQRFILEARLMASLNNKHLVPIYSTGESQIDGVTRYYIIMPFMEGGTLRARIRRSPLSPTEACRCLKDIASGLDYIHGQGIVHRDIKSSNVLLDADGRCYLSDFGIARMVTDMTQLTTTGNVLGTVDYVAPELFEPHRRANARSDLYSLGVLLFEMATGKLPFVAENQIALVSMHLGQLPPSPRTLNTQLSPQVESVILRALEKRPEQRYGSAGELANAFCHAVTLNNSSITDMPLEANSIGPHNGIPAPLAAPIRPSPLAGSYETSQFVPPPRATNLPTEIKESPLAVPSSVPPSQLPPRRRSWLIVLLVLLALIILAVPVAYLLVTKTNTSGGSHAITTPTHTSVPSPTATPNLTATAQSALAATATAHSQATATAIVAITVTAQAHATATAGVISTATSGQPAYQDTLKDPNNPATQAANWDQNDHCAFASDGYHVKEATSLHGCKEGGNQYQNVAISVDMRMLSGQSGGLFFRINTNLFNQYSGYLFEVDSTGRYRISQSQNYSTAGITPIQDWTTSPALKRGYNVTNTLQLIASGST